MILTICFKTKNQHNTVYKYGRKRSRSQQPFFLSQERANNFVKFKYSAKFLARKVLNKILKFSMTSYV